MSDVKTAESSSTNSSTLQRFILATYKFKSFLSMIADMDDDTIVDCFGGMEGLCTELESEINKFREFKKQLEKEENESQKGKKKKKVVINE